jgi:hypothetical protein
LAAIGGAVAHKDVASVRVVLCICNVQSETELHFLQLRGGVQVKIAVGGFFDCGLRLTVRKEHGGRNIRDDNTLQRSQKKT